MRQLIARTVLAGTLAMWTVDASAEVRVSMRNGRVSVVAKDATVRQILAEWARAGQTRIVNGEQVAGAPISIELTDVPERQALDILLRSAGGYLAAPRATALPNAAFFDRIIVLPTAAPRSSTVSSSAPPALPQPRFQPNPIDDDAPFQRAPFAPPSPQPAVPAGAAPQLTPAFQPGPPIQPGPAPSAAPPTSNATVPLGSSRPGVIAQPPQQPSQPGTRP